MVINFDDGPGAKSAAYFYGTASCPEIMSWIIAWVSTMGATMRAAVITAFGSIEGISLAHVVIPSPSADNVLIRVETSTIGFADTLTRRGIYPPGLTNPGIIPGGEVVGRIVSTGSFDSEGLVGSRVWALTGLGAHAEFVCAPMQNLIPLSDEIDPKIVAGFGVTSIVAQAALKRAGVTPEKTILVRGAAGGVGLSAVRLARLVGAKVVGTASSADRADFLRKLGIAAVLDRSGAAPDGPHPSIDIVIDPVGGDALSTFISMLGSNGVYMLLGAAGGLPDPDFGNAMITNFFKSISFSTLSLHSVEMQDRIAILKSILESHAAGLIEPDIDMVVSLDEIQAAHRRIEAGENTGKIILEF